jgi:hypothetical protein
MRDDCQVGGFLASSRECHLGSDVSKFDQRNLDGDTVVVFELLPDLGQNLDSASVSAFASAPANSVPAANSTMTINGNSFFTCYFL